MHPHTYLRDLRLLLLLLLLVVVVVVAAVAEVLARTWLLKFLASSWALPTKRLFWGAMSRVWGLAPKLDYFAT